METAEILKFASEQKTAFIASVNGQGYPVIRAMLAPRKIEGNEIYFTTNTSSNKVAQFMQNGKACVYFYKRGKIKYQGVSIVGENAGMHGSADEKRKLAVRRQALL